MCGFLGTISKQEINIDKSRTQMNIQFVEVLIKKEIFSNTREYNGLENSTIFIFYLIDYQFLIYLILQNNQCIQRI